jgi:guanylate kinase
VHRKDYLFIDRDEFERLRDAGGFLEWFDVYGDLKGTPRAPVEEHLAASDDVLLEVDVQGALAVKQNYPHAVLVFIRAPSREEQRRRLVARGQDDPEAIERRLAQADAEEALADRFDVVVVNDDPDRAAVEVAAILNRYREARMPPEPGSPPPAGPPDR